MTSALERELFEDLKAADGAQETPGTVDAKVVGVHGDKDELIVVVEFRDAADLATMVSAQELSKLNDQISALRDELLKVTTHPKWNL